MVDEKECTTLKITSLEEREMYFQIAGKMLKDASLLVDDILKICQEQYPSSALSTGGVLFELFILRRSKSTHAKLLEKHLRNSTVMIPTDMATFLRAYKFPFWFYLISTIRYFYFCSLIGLVC